MMRELIVEVRDRNPDFNAGHYGKREGVIMGLGDNGGKRKTIKETLNSRQALIKAAVCLADGELGVDGIWPGPVSSRILLDMAESLSIRARKGLRQALNDLVRDGLFVEVYRDLFDSPVYYCTYEAGFLAELPDMEKLIGVWNRAGKELDEKFSGVNWRTLGICIRVDDNNTDRKTIGLCLGTNCPEFKNSSPRCRHGLVFNMGFMLDCPACGQETVREEMVEFISPVYVKGEAETFKLFVCEDCADSRKALEYFCRRNKHFKIDRARTMEAFDSIQRGVIE